MCLVCNAVVPIHDCVCDVIGLPRGVYWISKVEHGRSGGFPDLEIAVEAAISEYHNTTSVNESTNTLLRQLQCLNPDYHKYVPMLISDPDYCNDQYHQPCMSDHIFRVYDRYYGSLVPMIKNRRIL